MFSSVYKSKKVVVTGNTGFKDLGFQNALTWRSLWNFERNFNISHFEILNLQERINHIYIDITDKKSLQSIESYSA